MFAKCLKTIRLGSNRHENKQMIAVSVTTVGTIEFVIRFTFYYYYY